MIRETVFFFARRFRTVVILSSKLMGLRKPPISILIQHGSPHSSPLLICEGVLHADPVERIVLLHQCPADWRSQTQHGASFFAEAAGEAGDTFSTAMHFFCAIELFFDCASP